MSSAQRAALDAMNAARPIVARLDIAKNSEDLAADIIEAWNAVETGLRSLVGGSALTGQMLIRELRQRQLLSLEQANALAEFHAARERAARTDYKPTTGDVNAAREAFLKLEAGLLDESPSAPGPRTTDAPAAAAASRATVPLDTMPSPRYAETAPVTAPVGSRRKPWLIPLLAVVALLIVGGIAWYALAGRGRSSAAYDEGVVAYREGRREAAAGAFIKATKDTPNDPMPHVYLSRMAREAGRLSTAQEEAVKAVQLGPTNAVALRELASASFAQQNYDAARRFYSRALQVDATDALSQGYLGCSLVRLGRLDEGARWIQRAGSGPWSACMPAPRAVPPGAYPPGASYPPGTQAPPGAYPAVPRS
jgi:tetratricopeptide (TPR) repeat protein